MRSPLIFVLFSLAGTLLQTEANPTLEDAVWYLFALEDDSEQNGYAIQPGSSRVQQFNRQYERVDASGITGDQGWPRLVEVCNGVIQSIKLFEEGSSLGEILMMKFSPANGGEINKILNQPDVPLGYRGSNDEKIVLELFKLDKVCVDLSLYSNARSSNPSLRDAIEYLLAYHTGRQRSNQIGTLGHLVMEACQGVTANIQNFNRYSPLGQIMMDRFGGTHERSIIKILNKRNPPVNHKSSAAKTVFGLCKMERACKMLFP